MESIDIFASIQSELKAPKDKTNSFGKYKYRNVEGILESLKPLLAKHEAVLTMSDDIVNVGDRYYVKATVTLWIGNQSYTCTAFAREALDKKGMDEAQITGACSSYARKYALGGLFAIDSGEADADETNTHGREPKKDSTPLLETEVKAIDKSIKAGEAKKALNKWIKENDIPVSILKKWAIDEKILMSEEENMTETSCLFLMSDTGKLKDLKVFAAAEQAKEIK